MSGILGVLLGDNASAGGASYTGPGDIVAATGWWGLRAYNAAYATGSNPAIDVVDQAGANLLTVNITSSGNLDTAAISTWVTANSVSTIRVKKIYDQVSTQHATQTTLALMMALVLNGLGSKPVLRGTATRADQYSVTLAGSIAQPLTIGAVINRTGDFTNEGGIFGKTTGGNCIIEYSNAANTLRLFGGSNFTATASDANFHSINAVLNGASSDINIDGSSNTGNAGTNGLNTSARLNGAEGFEGGGTVDAVEWGVWSSALSGANMTSLSSNQHTYWGF